MNFKFLIFLIIISFIYIWLSNTILIYWNVYKKYIQFGLILFTCILFYQKPDILSKIINKIIKINDMTQPPIILAEMYKNTISSNNNTISSNNTIKSKTTTNQKRNVTNLQKKVVASNQEWKCGKCNTILDASYEVDHIIPLYKGGSNETSNLMALCRNCHGKKTIEDTFIT